LTTGSTGQVIVKADGQADGVSTVAATNPPYFPIWKTVDRQRPGADAARIDGYLKP
jgi:hypothetical protein